MGYRADGRSVSAGQIDAFYVDKDGKAYLFDFKRVANNHKLDPKEKGFTPGRGTPPACGLGPMAHLPDTHYQKYSLQTSVYNLMLKDTHGIDVGDRMYLLRMHADRNAFELVQCRDLRAEAAEALRSEAARLDAQPPPASPAAPAAPQGGSPSHTHVGDCSPSQGSSETRKRPRGPTPKGKTWQDGEWVDIRQAKQVRTPATDLTLRVRPGGKAPRGKRWDAVAGGWVSAERGCCKHKAVSPPLCDENEPPRVRQRA